MAQRFGFFDSVNKDRRYNSTDMGRMFDGLIRDGIYMNYLEAFAIQPAGGMDIWVRPGRCWFDHRWFEVDEPLKISISSAHATWARWDVVVIEVNEAATVRSVSLRIMQGSPSSTPSEPPISATQTLHRYPIAAINVKAGTTTIDSSAIYDRRGSDACPWVANINGSIPVKGLTDQMSAEFQAWFSGLKDSALNPPDANAELAAVKSEVVTLKKHWDTGGMPTGSISSSTRIPLIATDGSTSTSSADVFAYEIFDGIPSAHNALCRGKNLGAVMTAEQAAQVAAGTFRDLWLGDYWTSGGREYVIAGFDYWYGLRGVTKHHLAVVSKYSASENAMHSGKMTNGVYYTDMYQKVLPGFRTQFQNVFGNRIITHPVVFINTYDASSNPKGYTSLDVDISIPDPGMVSTSGWTTGISDGVTRNRSSGAHLLPLVLFNSAFANTSANDGYWLNASYGPSSIAYMRNDGSIDQAPPTNSKLVWPIFAVGS